MPRFRTMLDQLSEYRAGLRPSQAGSDAERFIQLSANESSLPPFPEVVEAVRAAVPGVNRYPENNPVGLRTAIAEHWGVDAEAVLVAGGSNRIILTTALALSGPGTSAVFATPSFALYRLATIASGAEPLAVALDGSLTTDLDAMAAAVRDDTTVAYVCNPNNPTGTHVSHRAIVEFIDTLGEDVMVAIDEAYGEFVQAADFSSAVPLAVERPNVIVYRTFSKIYGLAGLRVGYAITHPDNLRLLRKVHLPFGVGSLGQVAAIEALRHPERVAARAHETALSRVIVEKGLAERGYEFAASEANFVYMAAPTRTLEALIEQGVICRRFDSGEHGTEWLRVTIGTEIESRSFLAALDRCGIA